MISTSIVSDWIADRSPEHREQVVISLLPMCKSAARKFARSTHDFADYEQIAALGLLKATDRFLGESPAAFAGYAWILIVGEVLHYLRDNNRIFRVPRRLMHLYRRSRIAAEALVAKLGREPTGHELTEAMDISFRDWLECEAAFHNSIPRSLDDLVFERGELDENLEAGVFRISLDRIMGDLAPIERRVILGIFDQELSVSEVARSLGVTERHVSRVKKSALKKLSSYVLAAG